MQRPWISINLAVSADGKIARSSDHPSNWTSAADHDRLRALRCGKDALLVGRGTWTTDRMTLRTRDGSQPLRCVVSRSGNFDPDHPMFSLPGGPIHLLATTADQPPAAIPGTIGHCGPLDRFLASLSTDYSVHKLHAEGGGSLIHSLAELDAIDEIHLTWAGHTLFGGASAPTLTGIPSIFLPASRSYDLLDMQPGPSGECFLHYRRHTPPDSLHPSLEP